MAMTRTNMPRLSAGMAGAARWTVDEFIRMLPAVIFFFAALMVILLLLKLFIEQYSIEFYAFSKAAVGALILAKVILLMDLAESKRHASLYPRAVVVAGKTVIYGLAVIAVWMGERIFDACRKTGDLRNGIAMMIANANLDRFLGCVLLICLIVSAYLTLQEINQAMGDGALFRLFFKAPARTSTGG
jgi:fumarate reductase subunit D